jgi:pyruvate dehydrogenase E1 component alpha subunit
MAVRTRADSTRADPSPVHEGRTEPSSADPSAVTPSGVDGSLPVRYLRADGTRTEDAADAASEFEPARLLAGYRAMVIGRRFDEQATALTKQGRLAVYPSAYGQEACQIGAVLALREQDWLFPTYRDTMAIASRGVDLVETVSLLRGQWHCGYDPRATRVAPQCTPLATHLPHAAGLAMAARAAGDDVVALALCGDGATSEGDFHEACNFAAVFDAPVVFLVQNNGYAISVPLSRQTRAAALADKAVGYGMTGVRVDGNDLTAVRHVVGAAVERARAGGGPTLVEAVTYRLSAHTNADDAGRYRGQAEVEAWLPYDPITRVEAYLRAHDLLDDAVAAAIREDAEAFAAELRTRLAEDAAGAAAPAGSAPDATTPDPMALFRDVFAVPTPQLREQAERLAAELAAEQEERR